MIRTHETTLRHALDRLRQALAYPLDCDDPEWGARLRRALAALGLALDRRKQALAVAALILRSRHDPFLPLFPASGPADARVLQELQKRAALLQLQVAGVTASAAPAGSATAVQAFRVLARAGRDAERLADDLDCYLAWGADAPAGQ